VKKLSAGAAVALQIGGAEAHHNNSSSIEREHLLIGLCSLEKALDEGSGIASASGETEALQVESESLDGFFRYLALSPVSLRRAIRRRLDAPSKKTGGPPQLSLACQEVLSRAEVLAEKHGASAVCAVHLLMILLQSKHDDIAVAVHNAGLDPSELPPLLARWSEIGDLDPLGRCSDQPRCSKVTPFLDEFGKDLTRAAKEGRLLPVVGRRKELIQLVRALSRRTKNFPVLVGDPGVGKTAIVEGLAQRIISGKALPGTRLVSISIGSALAGSKYRGEFEQRMLRLIEESRADPTIIIFFDEIHTLISAGQTAGSVSAADILKPAIAAGEIRCIGATTAQEYRRLVEADAALERRLQPILVTEPSREAAREMLKSTKSALESHHGVEIGSDALEAALDLSVRYVRDRKLPDKALDALDEACALVKAAGLYIGNCATVESAERKLVSRESVAEVISQWTRIPVQKLHEAEAQSRLDLESELLGSVVGQDEAIRRVARRIRRARAGLHDSRRPVGVFLFVGGTGVGKTELARALGEALFRSDSRLIRLDMTEFQEPHSISKLIGAPPGYVGYQKDGILSGRLRDQPYSMVLMDEIDKAHPDVLNIFLQVFEDGRLTDAKGHLISCTDAIFVMTANRGIVHGRPGFESGETQSSDCESVLRALRQDFGAEFLNRIDEIIVFRQLDRNDAVEIVRRRLDRLRERLLDRQKVVLRADDRVVNFVTALAYSDSCGARDLNRSIERLIEEPIGDQIVSGKLRERDQVIVQIDGEQLLFQTTCETE